MSAEAKRHEQVGMTRDAYNDGLIGAQVQVGEEATRNANRLSANTRREQAWERARKFLEVRNSEA